MAHRLGTGRALIVALAAVLLGVGTGAFIALRNRSTVAGPSVTSIAPAPSESSAASPAPSATPTPSRKPDPWSSLPASAPLNDQVIVWPRKRGGNTDIALLDLRTGKQKRLTTGSAIDRGPVISRNRRTIIYTQISGDQSKLRVMAANGKGDRPLFDRQPKGCLGLSRPAATPSGQLVVTCSTEAAPQPVRLLVLTLDGRIVRQLDSGRIGDPTVTPDGQSVIYWRSRQGDAEGGALYRIRLDGNERRMALTNGGDGEDADPVVSPDGRRVAFSRDTGAGRVIMTASFNGKDLIDNPRTRTHGKSDQDPSWSPNGRQIAYQSGRGDNAGLYLLKLSNGHSRQVVKDPGPDTVPAWTAP